MRSLRVLDILSGLVIAGIGLAFLLSSLGISDMLGERLPPWLLPLGLSAITIAAGLLLALKSWRAHAGADVTVDWPDRSGFLRLLLFVTLILVYLLAIPLLGMTLSTGLFTAVAIWLLNHRPVQAVVVAVSCALIVHYAFNIGLGMNFPAGIFG